MHAPLQRLSLLCSTCLLLACGSPALTSPESPTRDADQAYRMGRRQQLARDGAAAQRLYRQALFANPQHRDARNGLASLLAEQGDHAGAIALWQGLTAPLENSASRAEAYLFSNLGYAYFLSGQYAAAQQAQERACLLDPANPLVWQRLGSTLAKSGEAARAVRMLEQAQTLLQHDLHADATLAASVQAQSILVEGADGLLTLERTGTGVSATLEISNGNGVPGLARATARRLRTPALQVLHLNNEPGFGVLRSRIEYRARLRGAAEQLARQVPSDVVLVGVAAGLRTDLRLVLGRNTRS